MKEIMTFLRQNEPWRRCRVCFMFSQTHTLNRVLKVLVIPIISTVLSKSAYFSVVWIPCINNRDSALKWICHQGCAINGVLLLGGKDVVRRDDSRGSKKTNDAHRGTHTHLYTNTCTETHIYVYVYKHKLTKTHTHSHKHIDKPANMENR